MSVVPPPATRYPDFKNLQEEHAALLRTYHEGGGTDEFVTHAREFIARSIATGAVLDLDDERDAAQQFLDHWATLLYRISSASPESTLAEFDEAQLPNLREEDCPYLGLSSFGESQRATFFGRDRLLAQCARQLLAGPLLAVLGQSGSGKSSLVCGGLLPALRAGELPGWPAGTGGLYLGPMVPGNDPVGALLTLLAAHAPASQAFEAWRAHPEKEAPPLETLFPDAPNGFLIIDQFEEIFTLCDNDSARAMFLRLLVGWMRTPDTRWKIILTMRSEFETWVARAPSFYAFFSAGQVRMVPMSRAELRAAIEKPAQAVGLKFEPGVVDALLNDTLGEPAALPMLQFALLKLWQNRRHDRIQLRTYEALGGARLALANSANDFFVHLAPENQTTVRRVLLRMVQISEGLEVHSQRVKVASLYASGEDPNRIQFVVEQLAAASLVRITSDGAEQQIEVAHEALIRNWPTLLEWIQTKRSDLLTRRRLNEYAAEWIRRDRGEQALLDAELLQEAERWVQSDAAREFGSDPALLELIAASRARQTALSLAQARRIRRRVMFATALFVASVVLLSLGGYYFLQASRLRREVRERQQDLALERRAFDDLQRQFTQAKITFDEYERKTTATLGEKEREVDRLSQLLAAVKAPPERVLPNSEITVDATGTREESGIVAGVAARLEFKTGEIKTVDRGPAANAVTYSGQVGFKSAQSLALALVRAGVPVRALDRIPRQEVQPVIRVYGAAAALAGPVLTPEQIEGADDRIGPDLSEVRADSSRGAPVRIYYTGEGQRELAAAASAALAEVGYAVGEPSSVSRVQNSEVRYFRSPTDLGEARFIARLLSSFDLNIRPSLSRDPQLAAAATPNFEIWFGLRAPAKVSLARVPSVGRIFLQSEGRIYNDDRVQRLRDELAVVGFWVDVSRRPSPAGTSVRISYHKQFAADAKEAGDIAKLLQKLNFPSVEVLPFSESDPPGLRPRRFEISLP